MQGIKRKLVYAFSYELIAVGITGSALTVLAGHDMVYAGVAAVALSVIALIWNLLYNTAFEWWEAHQDKRGRGILRRIAHAAGFEAGLIIMLVPLLSWWLQISLWQAFLLDLGLLAFFLGYTFVFNFVFDRWLGLPVSATPKMN